MAALVLSLFGPIGCIPAIVCGHLARARFANHPQLQGKGLALAGLILGYLFLGLSLVGIGLCFVLGRHLLTNMG